MNQRNFPSRAPRHAMIVRVMGSAERSGNKGTLAERYPARRNMLDPHHRPRGTHSLPLYCLLAAAGCTPPQPTTRPLDAHSGSEAVSGSATATQRTQRLPAPTTAGPTPHTGERTAGTFEQLLRTRPQANRPECLLVRMRDGWLLGQSATLATRNWPEFPERVASVLEDPRERVRVLTTFGPLGDAREGPVLVAATALPPRAARKPTMAVFATKGDGLSVRFGDRPGQDALDVEGVARIAAEAARGELGSIWLTADRLTPVARLREVLVNLPSDPAVAFAIALPQSTRLSPPPTQPVLKAHCPAGLPEPKAERPEGDLEAPAIVDALAPLTNGAQRCLEQATGPAAAGGRVTLAVRIGERGAVEAACLVDDTIEDPTMAGCLVETARTLAFPAPSPTGFVDVQLPLSLAPGGGAPAQRICQ